MLTLCFIFQLNSHWWWDCCLTSFP